MTLDIEALKAAAKAVGPEQWHSDGTGTLWLSPTDPVNGPEDDSSAVIEVYLRADEKDPERQAYLTQAHPAAVLALIERLERAEAVLRAHERWAGT